MGAAGGRRNSALPPETIFSARRTHQMGRNDRDVLNRVVTGACLPLALIGCQMELYDKAELLLAENGSTVRTMAMVETPERSSSLQRCCPIHSDSISQCRWSPLDRNAAQQLSVGVE